MSLRGVATLKGLMINGLEWRAACAADDLLEGQQTGTPRKGAPHRCPGISATHCQNIKAQTPLARFVVDLLYNISTPALEKAGFF